MIINDFWQSVRPAISIGKSKGYFTVPWASEFIKSFLIFGRQAQNTPQVVWQWNYTSANNFTIKYPITAPVIPATNPFILCVRFNIGKVVYRYKLWSAEGDDKIFAPLYVGQPISKNFCIELWSLTVSLESDNVTLVGDNHGADNIIPAGSIYDGTFNELVFGQHYYYDPSDDGGATHGYWTGAAYLANGAIFTPSINDELRGPANTAITAMIKLAPELTFNFTNATDFKINTSQLKVKSAFNDSDTFLAMPAGTQCIPWLPESNNLNNYPFVGTGVGALPIAFKACVSDTNN